MSDLIVEIKRVDDGLLIVYQHSLIDILESEGVSYDEGQAMVFDDNTLVDALAAYRRRIANGLVIYRKDGTAVRGTLVGAMGKLPVGSVAHQDLAKHRFQLSLRFPSDDIKAEFETVSFDFGNWRLGNSAIITSNYVDFPDILHPVLWSERGLYPLFPETDRTTFLGTMSILAVPSLNSPDIGFSTLSVESDHFRHELLLPVGTALSLVDWADGEEPSAHDLLNEEQRQRIGEALRQRAFTSKFARIQDEGRILPADTRRIRWFDRASLRRGLALVGQEIPVATGFIGMVEIYRPQPMAAVLIDLGQWKRVAYHLAFTAREGDKVLTRRVGLELEEPWEVEVGGLVPMTVPEVGAEHRINLQFLLLGLAILGFIPVITWRRGRLPLIGILGAVVIVALAVVPPLGPALTKKRFESQLRQAFSSAVGTDERRGLELLQAICTPELASQLFIESRNQLSGPWAVRSGLDIEDVSLTEFTQVSSHQARAVWTVRCRIRHWGHGHDRTVSFDALIGFTDDGRLATMELLDKQLIEAASAKLKRG